MAALPILPPVNIEPRNVLPYLPKEWEGKCTSLGSGSEGEAYKCGDTVYKFFRCSERTWANPPDQIPSLWNNYMSQVAKRPDLANATLSRTSELFPEDPGLQKDCDHAVLITPFIPGRQASPLETLQANAKYKKTLGLSVEDARIDGNVKVPEGSEPLIIDFGKTRNIQTNPEPRWYQFLENAILNVGIQDCKTKLR